VAICDFPQSVRTDRRFEALYIRLTAHARRDLTYATGLLCRLDGLARRIDSPGLAEVVIRLRIALLRDVSRRYAERQKKTTPHNWRRGSH